MIAGTEAQQTAQVIVLLIIAAALWVLLLSIVKVKRHWQSDDWQKTLDEARSARYRVHFSRWVESGGWPCGLALLDVTNNGGIMTTVLPENVTCSECLASPLLSRVRPQSGQYSALDNRPLNEQRNDRHEQHDDGGEYQDERQVVRRHPMIVPKPRYRRAGA